MAKLITILSILLIHFSIFTQTVATVLLEEEASEAYTLFSPNSSDTTYLINPCGEIINKWISEFTPGLSAYLINDGKLLRTKKMNNSYFTNGGNGGGIELFDWDNNLLWEYVYSNDTICQHHDIEYLPNGNLLILAWEKKTKAEAVLNGRDSMSLVQDALWPEHIIEVEMIGNNQVNVVWEWHIWDHLIQNYDSTLANFGQPEDHPELLNINYFANTNADWLHVNSIDYNPDLDQILLSSNAMKEMWIIDHSTSSQEAASHNGGNSGKGGDLLYRWGNPQVYNRGDESNNLSFKQHDAKWIPAGFPHEGNILFFNNGQGRNYSTVDIITPPLSGFNYEIANDSAFGPETHYWTYQDQDDPFEFFSQNISGAHMLANGNVQICSGRQGVFYEVDWDKNKLWKYINPAEIGSNAIQGTNATVQASVFRAEKYMMNDQIFTGKDISPKGYIEGNSNASFCELSNAIGKEDFTFTTFPNPSVGPITIDCHLMIDLIEIYSIEGKLIFSEKEKSSINLSSFTSGFYFLKIYSDQLTSVQIIEKL